VIEQAKSGFV